MRCSALRYIALHCVALRRVASRCVALCRVVSRCVSRSRDAPTAARTFAPRRRRRRRRRCCSCCFCRRSFRATAETANYHLPAMVLGEQRADPLCVPRVDDAGKVAAGLRLFRPELFHGGGHLAKQGFAARALALPSPHRRWSRVRCSGCESWRRIVRRRREESRVEFKAAKLLPQDPPRPPLPPARSPGPRKTARHS